LNTYRIQVALVRSLDFATSGEHNGKWASVGGLRHDGQK